MFSVNAIERNSKPLWSRVGQFVERVLKGAFSKALERNHDVRILLNHDESRDLGGQADGNLELCEDAIGLRARACIYDKDVIEDARAGNLVGWSFGFCDVPDGVERSIDTDTGLPLRKLKDLDLREVSILNNTKSPAYEGTLVTVRSEDEMIFRSETFSDEIRTEEEVKREEKEPEQETEAIDYSEYDNMIKEMKGE